jgi:hypothetical protein
LVSSDLTASQAPTETDIVDAAAEVAFPGALQQDSIKGMWRTHSGDAHGLPWPMFTRSSTEAVHSGRVAGYPGRMAEYTSGGDLWEIAESFSACFRLARRGWSLFDQRCESAG